MDSCCISLEHKGEHEVHALIMTLLRMNNDSVSFD